MSRRALTLFVALGVVWGIPYLLIKVAVDELSPAQIVLGRTAIAALILLPLALARGAVQPVLREWRWLVLFAIVEDRHPLGAGSGTPRPGSPARPPACSWPPYRWPAS